MATRIRATIKTKDVRARRHSIYADVLKRVNEAIADGYYLEAITLLESIIADRLESICNEKSKSNDFAFKCIGDLIIAAKKFSLSKTWQDVLNNLDMWRAQRNSVLHEMAKIAEGDISTFEKRYKPCKSFAKEGKKIFREIDNQIRKYRKNNNN